VSGEAAPPGGHRGSERSQRVAQLDGLHVEVGEGLRVQLRGKLQVTTD
jgi:hypothetical protein